MEMAVLAIPYHCPHLNSWEFEKEERVSSITWEDYMAMDLHILDLCSGILMIDGWEGSKGAVAERQFALMNNIPFYHSIKEIPAHMRLSNIN